MERFFKRPWIVVAVVAAITAFFAAQLPRAELNNDNIRFVPEDDPARLLSEEISDMFGSSTFILVGLEHKYGTVFDPAFLAAIKVYTEYIDGQCAMAGDITSIMNTDYITASGDSIAVQNLVPDDFTGTPDEIAALRQRLLSWEMYDRALVSEDFTATQILIPLEIDSKDAGSKEVMDTTRIIRDTAREMFGRLANVYVAGIPVISFTISEAMGADLVYLIPLVIVVVLAVLFFSFRKLASVLLPLITVMIAVIWSIGAMPLAGVKLSVLSTVLPVILVAVGSAYGIHVVTHYREDLGGRGLPLSPEEHRSLVFALLRKIGKPVALAAFTTFAGFASFCFTTVPPIREFGYFSSFGVLASFIVAVTLIPALLLIRGQAEPAPDTRSAVVSPSISSATPPSVRQGRLAYAAERHRADAMDDALTGALLGTARMKYRVLFFAGLVTAVSIYGMSKLVIDNVFVEYFKSDTDVRRSDVFVREKFGGSKVVNVVVESDTPAALLMPEALAAIDGLSEYLNERVSGVGKVMGFTDLIKRTNQVWNADESTDGVRRGLTPAYEAAADDFGFGGGFGFDDFGFGDEGGGEPVGGVKAGMERGGEAAPTAIAVGMEGATGMATKTSPPSPPFPPFPPQNTAIDIALLDRAAVSPGAGASELVWRVKRLLNYEGAAYYEIPADPARYGKTDGAELSALVSNYLVLIGGSAGDYANDALEPTAIKTTVQLRTTGDADTKAVLARIDEYIADNFPPSVRAVVGGTAMVEASLSFLVVQSQIISVAVSILMVFLIIAFSNRSAVAGLVGILPLSISILINFAAMGFLGIKLNLGTSLVASVSVGIGIDYAIHFIEAYKREYRAGGDFLRRAFATSGRAIIINAVSVGAGFAVLSLSQFVILANLGLLMALTMFTSALISLTVVPALLTVLKPRFIYK